MLSSGARKQWSPLASQGGKGKAIMCNMPSPWHEPQSEGPPVSYNSEAQLNHHAALPGRQSKGSPQPTFYIGMCLHEMSLSDASSLQPPSLWHAICNQPSR